MFADGIRNGTISWDALVMENLSLVLQSATAADSANFSKSHKHADDLTYLAWEHISIRMINRDGEDVLIATVDLEYTKDSS